MTKQPKSARIALIGEVIEVADSPNQALIGLCGQVVDETRNTIRISTKHGEKTIIKEQTILKVNGKEINGKQLSGRIQERIKQ